MPPRIHKTIGPIVYAILYCGIRIWLGPKIAIAGNGLVVIQRISMRLIDPVHFHQKIGKTAELNFLKLVT